MLLLAAAATALACAPDPARRQGPASGGDPTAFIPRGWSTESMHLPDLDRDGRPDLVLVIRDADNENRRLIAAIATPSTYRNVGEAPLPGYPMGVAGVELTPRGVLVITDLTGGTTAIQAVYRYRYEGKRIEAAGMRFIGLDVTHYSRTNRHDALRLSFNWLTGDFSRRVDKLTRRGDYAPQKPVTGKDQPRCWFMEDTEDPENFVQAEFEKD